MFLVSIDGSEVPTPYGAVRLHFKFRFRVDFFLFLRLGIVSLPYEWSWAIILTAASVVAPYWEPTTAFPQVLFWWKNFEDEHCPSPWLFAAPYLELSELSLIFYVKLMENIFPMSPRLGLR
jgi:hypothetical protein